MKTFKTVEVGQRFTWHAFTYIKVNLNQAQRIDGDYIHGNAFTLPPYALVEIVV